MNQLTIPDPTKAIPEQGLIEVLTTAVEKWPLVTVILTLATVVIVFGLVCWCIVMCTRYTVMKHPDAGRVMLEQDKLRKAHQRFIKKMKDKNRKR